jgi:thiamine-monophosphate kinase
MDENGIVRLIQRRFQAKDSSVIRGIGDDAAVLRWAGARNNWVITTDMLLEDIDFRASWLTPAELGHKALAVNLSDLAAMGAAPRFYTVALAMPATVARKWIESLYGGMAKLARRFGAVLIGGDLSRSPMGVQISITAIGEMTGKPAYRSGGRPGDVLYVTGTLGCAAAGLQLLMRGQSQGENAAQKRALAAQRTPQPRCDAGSWLARSGLVRSMMDLSDGLSMDLPRLCAASKTGAVLYSEQIPAFEAAGKWGMDPIELALNGGEDFELLFSVPASKAGRLEKTYPSTFPPITRIGVLSPSRSLRIGAHPGVRCIPLVRSGFDHFQKAQRS